MDKAFISVIIPCFNSAKTIVRALNSVRDQTLRVNEIICIDDCSSDNTIETIKLFTQNNPAIDLIILTTKNNSGPSTARNLGWDKVSNQYIAFLDSDNAWHPQKMEVQYLWMLENPNICGSGHAKNIILDSLVDGINNDNISFSKHLVTKREILLSNPFETSSVILKKDIPYRFKEGKRYCEDFLLWMEICLNGEMLYKIDIDLTHVFKVEGSLSSNLFLMRCGDISNYIYLYTERKLDLFTTLALINYSTAKFILLIFFKDFHLSVNKYFQKIK